MVTKKNIDIIKDHIVETTNPERIILFGSYGRGAPTEDSDLDILKLLKKVMNQDTNGQEISEKISLV